MKTSLQLISFSLALMVGSAAAAQTTVNVDATASTRDAAIEKALGDALVDALGSHVFSVTTMTDDQFNTMSTSVTSGKIDDYEVLEEYETFEGVHVRLAVDLSDQTLASLAPKEVVTWNQKIEGTQALDMAQRSISDYRNALDEFLVGPRHQLNAGYAFVLRSYDVDAVGSNSLSGHIYVDVSLNQSWWNTYYELVSVLTPQGSDVVREGRIKVFGDTAKVDPGYNSLVDKSLQYDLAHPLPVRVSVGNNVSRFILYKNALLLSAQPMTEDTARTDYQREQARQAEISMTKGNVPAGDALVDREKSALGCGVVTAVNSAVYCGDRFTIKIPVEARNEAELIDMMKQGVKVELDLYGSACENDCNIFEKDNESELDPNQLLKDFLDKNYRQ